MKLFFFLLLSAACFAQLPDAPEWCDFRLQSCIREGEMISTTWNGSAPDTCYTRSGDSLIPDPCTGKHRHVEPSVEYMHGLPTCCREFPQPAQKQIAQLPDAPQPHDTWKEFTGKDAGFWTFRKSPNYPALRTNRQVLHSKTILVSHAVGFAAMAVACSRRKTSHESWDSEVPAMLGMTALDLFVSDKYFTRAYAVAPMIYAAQHYAIAAAK